MLDKNIALLGILAIIGNCGRADAAIIFLKEPTNATIFEGDSGYFACEYSGIGVPPTWRISSREYGSTFLPSGFTYNRTGLIVSYVTREMNGISISCLFPLTSGDIESSTGYIIVVTKPQVQSSSFHQISSHMLRLTTTPFGSATATEAFSTTLPGRQTSVAFAKGAPPIMENKAPVLLIVFLAAGLVLLVLVTVTVFCLIYIHREKGRKSLLKSREKLDNLYDEVKISHMQSSSKMTDNAAYVSLPKTVQVQINQSYASTKCVPEKQTPSFPVSIQPSPLYETVH